MHGRNRRLRLAVLLATTSLLGGAASAGGIAPSLSLNPTENHPNSTIQVSGSGFGKYQAVDIYFDATDEALAIANGTGGFSNVPVPAPANALPGTHYISAVERNKGKGAQQIFTVNTDWAEFHFDHKLKSLNPWENVLTTGNVSSLDEAWTGQTGYYVESSPAVVGGVVYVGSDDGFLYTFNSVTGAPGWFSAVGSEVTSSPAVANGIVYATDSNGSLVAINATAGELVWSATLGGLAYDQAPVVVNGIVYIGCDDDNLYAFNASTGALLWKSATGGPIYASSPAVSNGVIYIGSSDDNLYAFNASTGALLWKSATGGPIDYSSPSVANGTVYVGSDDSYLYAFDAGSGAQLWNVNAGSFVESSPTVANGVVYLNSGGNILAFSSVTGTQIWSIGGMGYSESSPAVANGVVYVGSCPGYPPYYDAEVVALNAATGAELWSAETGGDCIDSSPAVSNGMIYVGSFDDNLYAYALNGGNDPVYRKKHKAPAIPSLHPNYNLKPAN